MAMLLAFLSVETEPGGPREAVIRSQQMEPISTLPAMHTCGWRPSQEINCLEIKKWGDSDRKGLRKKRFSNGKRKPHCVRDPDPRQQIQVCDLLCD